MSEGDGLKISIQGPGRCSGCDAPLPKGTEGTLCPTCAAQAPAADEAAPTTGADAAPAEGADAADAVPPDPTHADGHGHTHRIPPGEEPAWIDHAENVQKMVRVFWVLCGLALAVDLLEYAGLYHKHPHFSGESVPGFYGFYGFVACVLLVLLAKQLRKVVMRGEDYYDG